MTTAIIGVGNIGGAVARELASGGEPVLLSATSSDKAQKLAAEIGTPATAALDNRDAVQRADLAPDQLASSVTATIEVASIDTNNPQRDDDLRSANFFESDTYLTMTCRSTHPGRPTPGAHHRPPGGYFFDGGQARRRSAAARECRAGA